MRQMTISKKDAAYLKELARKQLEYANLPVMEERRKLWYAHNAVKAERPVLVMEMDTFAGDMIPALKCETEQARNMEWNLLYWIVNHEKINDDKVVPPDYTVYMNIGVKEYGFAIPKEYGEDSSGRRIGFTQHHPVSDLEKDFHLLKPFIFTADREDTLACKNLVGEVLGDILPVQVKNNSLVWYTALSSKIVDLMGMENMLYSLVDYPDEMHQLMRYLTDNIKAYVKWQQREGLLTLNNGNNYAGAGSYGFTNELPTDEGKKSGLVTPKDLWGNLNSQETVGISADMFGEFFYPYYKELAEMFGLVYYGCCEPVHGIWDRYLSKLPGLRKVSISPWCDEDFMGSALRGSKVIYSRKPRPNYIGEGSFDETAYTEHITDTLKAAKGCSMEIIFRDVYTLSGDQGKPGRAIGIARKLIENIW
jgi:hypothetical protein